MKTRLAIFAAVAIFVPLLCAAQAVAPTDGNPLKLLFGAVGFWKQIEVLLALSLIGVIGHYAKQYVNDEVAGSPLHYLILDQPKRSIAMVIGVGAAVAGIWLSGLYDTMTLAQVALSVIPTAYAGDSVLNKGSAPDAENKV